MKGVSSSSFLVAWHDLMEVLAILLFVGGVVVYIAYRLRAVSIKDFREKHDFINTHEIKWTKWVFYLFGLGVAMIVNMHGADEVKEMGVWFFVRAFVSVAGATLVGYVASMILDFQYPSMLDSKLKRWRHEPRINPNTNNAMQLFDESEEYVRLHKDEYPEGEVHSMDYDVWVDMGIGDVKIEEYDCRLASLLCRNCGHHTMKVVDEELVAPEVEGKPDELLRHYRCTYCKNIRATQFYISEKKEEDYRNQKPGVVRHAQNVDAVKIEIQSTLLGKQFHEFETIDQAKKFLNEYGLAQVT